MFLGSLGAKFRVLNSYAITIVNDDTAMENGTFLWISMNAVNCNGQTDMMASAINGDWSLCCSGL